MCSKENLKWLCCTWQGVDRLKKGTALCTGAAVIVSSILTILNPFGQFEKIILAYIRSGWNFLFGLIMVLVQVKWTEWVHRRFNFLTSWFGKAFFFLL